MIQSVKFNFILNSDQNLISGSRLTNWVNLGFKSRMPSLLCDTCYKTFAQKSHLEKHKARKTPCKKNEALEKLIEKKVQEAVTSALQKITEQLNEIRAKLSLPIVPPESENRMTDAPAPESYSLVKPVLKWVGGKTQILEDVLAQFPKEIRNYHEPFLGGGSVLLGVLSAMKNGTLKIKGKVYASDLNPNLIHLYQTIQTNPDGLLTELKILQDEFKKCKSSEKKGEANREPKTKQEAMTFDESYYYWIRSQFNALSVEERKQSKASAMLVFLNKTCFRGVYREGPNGFNVPFGHYKNPGIFEEAHIREVSKLIKDVEFRCHPFQKALKACKPGDFAYLDPPYAPETTTSFVSYTGEGFSLEHHTELFTLCKGLKGKGVDFLLSNADVKLVRDAFPSDTFETKIISCRRAIHSKNPETKTNEVLIKN
jgi:DNA adenine methylase